MIQGTRTTYKGYTLRSLHELAWAEWFDKQNIPWEYEAVKFREGKQSYIPDFCIEKTVCLEIKASFTQKVNALSLCTRPLLFIVGLPARPTIYRVVHGAMSAPRLTNFAAAYNLARNGLPSWMTV